MSLAARPEQRFIDPQVLARLANLQVVARTVVEGFITGLHRSPYHGFSLDFAEYREYSPGDDIRGVDWKVFARTDRFFVKKYEGETNTRVYLLLDVSRSMSFRSHHLSKLEYGKFLAASLAYFAHRQKDAPGLILFAQELLDYLPPRSRHGHLSAILHRLQGAQPAGSTDIARALAAAARFVNRRSLIVLISDLYQEVQEVTRALRYFHSRGNDLILFHVLDPVELELPFDQFTTLEDMETGEHLSFVPQQSRQDYLNLLQRHIESLRDECRNISIDYVLMNSEEPLDAALYRYLAARERKY